MNPSTEPAGQQFAGKEAASNQRGAGVTADARPACLGDANPLGWAEDVLAEARAWKQQEDQRIAGIIAAWSERSEGDRLDRLQAASEGTGSATRPGLSPSHISPQGSTEWLDLGAGLHIADGAQAVKVRFPHTKRTGGQPQREPSKRSKVTVFSRKSRKRLMDLMFSISRKKNPAQLMQFATLTLPGKGYTLPEGVGWHHLMDALRKRVERRYGKLAIIWRMEFQTRKSGEALGLVLPHWHLLIRASAEIVKDLPAFRRWLARAWWEVVSSGEVAHLVAGTQVDPVKSWNGVAAYTGKYLGKLSDVHPTGPEGEALPCGRLWGVWNKAEFEISWKWMALSLREAVQVWRQVKRCCRFRKGVMRRNRLVYMQAVTAERLAHFARGCVVAGGSYVEMLHRAGVRQ